jgi:hypothetical protein
MAPNLTEEEIDDLLYFARTGDKAEFNELKDELCKRENLSEVELLEAARDEESGNGVLHMAAANGHSGILSLFSFLLRKALFNVRIQNSYANSANPSTLPLDPKIQQC